MFGTICLYVEYKYQTNKLNEFERKNKKLLKFMLKILYNLF